MEYESMNFYCHGTIIHRVCISILNIIKSKDYRPQLFDKIQIHNTKPFMVTHVYSLFGFYGLVKTTND